MRYPFGLVYDSAKHLVGRRLRGERKFALAVTLDLMGAYTKGAASYAYGNGTGTENQSPTEMLSVAECQAAIEECGAPVVVLSGGEPLAYPEIAQLTRAILKLRKHLFLCTDGMSIRRHLHMIPPVRNFFWNVKLDGTEPVHDARIGRTGVFSEAMDGIRSAKNAGFFVTVTSTVHPNTDVSDLVSLYERLHGMHVDGYTLTPHYPSEKLCCNGSAKFKKTIQQRFHEASERLGIYNLAMSPVYLEYLRGERELDCSVWANPVYGPKGWVAPCYLQNAKFVESYSQLLEKTIWENYGRGLNPRCENCMCPEGFETAAILGINGRAGDWWKNLAWQWSGGLGEKRPSRG
jgi:hopanoid biosynthesis associated radical SAM protein HpnH